jgi:polyphosphate kinase
VSRRADAGAGANPFINRELSWLAFNERVLEEAADAAVPLFERLKFASIVASNLDEFFMVRVAGLMRDVEAGETSPDPAGLTPAQQLHDVRERARAQMLAIRETFEATLKPGLAAAGVGLLAWNEVPPLEQARLTAYFRDEVLPVLTPLAIDGSRPFPLLASLSLNLALLLEPAAARANQPDTADAAPRLAIVQVPPRLTRLMRVADRGAIAFVLLEDVIRAGLPQLFPGQAIREAACIRISRDAELELDDEGGRTHLERVEREVRRRRRSDIVRLEIEATASAELKDVLSEHADLDAEDMYALAGPLDLRVLMAIADLPGFEPLRDPPVQPVNALAGDDRDLFSVLESRDLLLHHPYDAFDPVLALVAQAADDPEVLAIKQTLYRASTGSPLVAGLQRAAERGKQVTVVVELTARFDEERNIQWARALEAAGAHVIYGVRGYKTHAKMCLIVRRCADGVRRYLHLGTGNYNERTARLYTDFGLMTTSRALCTDASAVFNAITGYSDPPRLAKLTMAPTGLRRRFLRLIDRERRWAEGGRAAGIVAKMNSLSDKTIVEALCAASRGGVRIRLNVRGVCTLRPGVPGVSANIEVVSVVDRFLEHARAYAFRNGGDDELYLSSADWMTRNLDKRIELMFPIEADDHKRAVMASLEAMFKDNVKARRLGADGVYRRVRPSRGEPPFRVQQFLQDEARRAAELATERAGIMFQPEGREPSS